MPRRHHARLLLPRAVAVLGELGSLVLHDPNTGAFFGVEEEAGRILCADETGRWMYILRPLLDGQPVKATSLVLRAAALHERFVHRTANEHYNCVVPPFRAPRFAGELVILRYVVEKDIGDLDPDEDGMGLTVWEHYFERPGVGPAYAELWSVGRDQWVIPPGAWRITSRGIEFAKE